MFCAVHRIRYRGQPLDSDVVRKSYGLGDLIFRVRLAHDRPERSVMMAMLLKGDGATYVYPVLDRARLVKIHGDGLLITGVEVIPYSRGAKNIKSDYYQQSWWCLPRPRPTPGDDVGATGQEQSDDWRSRSARQHAERFGIALTKPTERR